MCFFPSFNLVLDINECIEANDCMHNCSNLPGGRHCSCFEGFQVDPKDKTACIREYAKCIILLSILPVLHRQGLSQVGKIQGLKWYYDENRIFPI